nr:hypothetical protein Iba_chr07fCG5980 [Ipomoea batatas]
MKILPSLRVEKLVPSAGELEVRKSHDVEVQQEQSSYFNQRVSFCITLNISSSSRSQGFLRQKEKDNYQSITIEELPISKSEFYILQLLQWLQDYSFQFRATKKVGIPTITMVSTFKQKWMIAALLQFYNNVQKRHLHSFQAYDTFRTDRRPDVRCSLTLPETLAVIDRPLFFLRKFPPLLDILRKSSSLSPSESCSEDSSSSKDVLPLLRRAEDCCSSLILRASSEASSCNLLASSLSLEVASTSSFPAIPGSLCPCPCLFSSKSTVSFE